MAFVRIEEGCFGEFYGEMVGAWRAWCMVYGKDMEGISVVCGIILLLSSSRNE